MGDAYDANRAQQAEDASEGVPHPNGPVRTGTGAGESRGADPDQRRGSSPQRLRGRGLGAAVGYKAAGLTLGFAIGTGVAVTALGGPGVIWGEGEERPARYEPTRVETLLGRHDCWTNQAPEGVIPGRAVVTLPGQQAKVVHADVGFGIWLDNDPGTLHGFCR